MVYKLVVFKVENRKLRLVCVNCSLVNMKSKKELEQELREEYGSDEYPLVRTVKISSLTEDQLIVMLEDKGIPVEYPVTRQYLEDMMMAVLDGSDEVVNVDVVSIESMTEIQLKEALEKINKSKKTIRQIQQEFAENCGYGDDIIWDQ